MRKHTAAVYQCRDKSRTSQQRDKWASWENCDFLGKCALPCALPCSASAAVNPQVRLVGFSGIHKKPILVSPIFCKFDLKLLMLDASTTCCSNWFQRSMKKRISRHLCYSSFLLTLHCVPECPCIFADCPGKSGTGGHFTQNSAYY